MSKFINTKHMTTINSLVEGLKERLNNPYYLFNDQKACITDYYNINKDKSTLDEGMKSPYALIGGNSPLKFNHIKDAYLFGIDRVQLQQDIGEYGLESESIEGEAIVLPNTFIPIPNDYFKIRHVDQNIIFKVINVTIDTLESGANFYKIQYKLDRYDDDRINDQVVERYTMVVNNVGTQYNTIIRSNDYDLIQELDDTLLTLKKYYKNLFFDKKVQTFSYVLDGEKMYDPYLIEFLIRNKLLEGDDEYLYVSHQAYVGNTFAIEYDKSFFKSVETGNKDKLNKSLYATAFGVADMNSLMTYCARPYYMINYNITPNQFITKINIFDAELMTRIQSGKLYSPDIPESMYNILIAFFNDIKIDTSLLSTIDTIDYNYCKDVFYAIPFIIYSIEYYIKSLLK